MILKLHFHYFRFIITNLQIFNLSKALIMKNYNKPLLINNTKMI